MNERYDVDGTGPDGPGGPDGADGRSRLDVRTWLEDASAPAHDGHVDVERHWVAGRRRRTGKRVGAGALGGVAAAAVGALVWQAGFAGGSVPRAPSVATAPVLPSIPRGSTTFVFAAPGAPDVDPLTISALPELDPDALRGTSWTLLDDLYGGGPTAAVVGVDEPTTLRFSAEGVIAVRVAECGAVPSAVDAPVRSNGRFGEGQVAMDGVECADDDQTTAVSFWTRALEQGGTVQRLGEQWLLVSFQVDRPQAAPDATEDSSGDASDDATQDATQDATDDAGTPRPTPSDEPTDPAPPPPSNPDPTGAAPTTGTTVTAPPGGADGTGAAQTGAGETDPGETGAGETGADQVPVEDPGPAFLDPALEWVDEPWPAAGGSLLAPTVRAGAHETYDRIVVDLTGVAPEGAPGWRAVYTDEPTRDGSGLPVVIAGDSVLEVRLGGMGYPAPGNPVYDGGDLALGTPALRHVVEVVRTTPFEGNLSVFVGLQGEPRPYRVFLLQDPMRLVIDVER